MINNYRGKQVTWDRLFEVLEDYLDGRREYSYNKEKEVCYYRRNGTSTCETACLIGSFMPDDKYNRVAMEYNDTTDETVIDSLDLAPGITETHLYHLQQVHDRLAARYIGTALENLDDLVVPTEYQARKEEMIKKIQGMKSNNTIVDYSKGGFIPQNQPCPDIFSDGKEA
jgi:hypothetical protein